MALGQIQSGGNKEDYIIDLPEHTTNVFRLPNRASPAVCEQDEALTAKTRYAMST